MNKDRIVVDPGVWAGADVETRPLLLNRPKNQPGRSGDGLLAAIHPVRGPPDLRRCSPRSLTQEGLQPVAAAGGVRFPFMWTTVLVMALAVIFEPVRLGLAVLMLNRPRPMLQLLAFLCGGFTMGMSVGLVTLFVLRATPLAGNGNFTVAKVQIATGLIALLVAGLVASNISARFSRVPADATVGGDAGVALLESTPPSGLRKHSERARQFLQGDSLLVAAVSGLGTALPSANYLGAIAAILASGAAPGAQVQAVVTFNVVAFTLVEIPLISFLAAPRKTREFMAKLHEWLRSRSHREAAILLAAVGFFMLALGVSGL